MSHSSLIQDSEAGGWWRFGDARDVILATRIEEVLPALQDVERRVERERFHRL
jgi:hypothetical protein